MDCVCVLHAFVLFMLFLSRLSLSLSIDTPTHRQTVCLYKSHTITHLGTNLQNTIELVHIILATRSRKDTCSRDGMELADIAGKNLVATGQTRVGRHHGIVLPGYGHDGPTVVVVRRKAPLVGSLRHAMINGVVVYRSLAVTNKGWFH